MHRVLSHEIEKRLDELLWYAHQHELKAEPRLYPPNLFKVASNERRQYQIQYYIQEIQADVHRLSQLDSPLMEQRLADKVLQKIAVLVASFKSRRLREKKCSSLESLLRDVNATTGNTLTYFKKGKKAGQEDITELSHGIEERLETLHKRRNKKVAKLPQLDKGAKLRVNDEVKKLDEQIKVLSRELQTTKERWL